MPYGLYEIRTPGARKAQLLSALLVDGPAAEDYAEGLRAQRASHAIVVVETDDLPESLPVTNGQISLLTRLVQLGREAQAQERRLNAADPLRQPGE